MNRTKALILPHAASLRIFIRKRIGDQSEAEDVLQDVYEEYLEATDLGVAIESLGAWLIRVARNKIIDRFRRQKSQQEYVKEIREMADSSSISRNEDWTSTWIREALIAAIEKLTPEQKEVFIMHELEGKSFEEISKATGIGINTLLARKHHAIQSLRDQLKEIYNELE